MTKPKRTKPSSRPARAGAGAGAGNERLTTQIRKVLGKHYANRYGRKRG